MSDPGRIEEARLRRALRLESDERPPRLDLAVIRAAAARPGPTPPALRVGTAAAFGILSLAAVATGVRLASELVAQAFTGVALDVALGALAFVSVPLESALAIVTHPSTPLAILAAVAVAMFHQWRTQPRRVE